MAMRRKKVFMLVLNELIYDSRVLKSAQSMAEEYDLLLVGIWRRKFDLNQELEREKYPFKMAWIDLGRASKAPRNILGHGIRYLKVYRQIRSLGYGFKPDLIHAHDLSALPIGRAIQKRTKARLIYDAHELYRDTVGFSPIMMKFLSKIETNLMQYCDGIIACNSPRAQIMRDEYGAPFLPTVIENMARYRPYSPSSALQDTTGSTKIGISKLVLYQGAIIPGRGLEILPQSLKLLPNELGMVLMGSGEPSYIQYLLDSAGELGVSQRFFILPPVLQSQLFTYTCSADIGIVIYQNTCRNNYFCAPNKLYEYAAAGTPMVGAQLPTIQQFIEEESVGALFDPESAEALAGAIQEVAASETTYARLLENCLSISRKYSWESTPEIKLKSLYANILEN